jgi:hypothetical protein
VVGAEEEEVEWMKEVEAVATEEVEEAGVVAAGATTEVEVAAVVRTPEEPQTAVKK